MRKVWVRDSFRESEYKVWERRFREKEREILNKGARKVCMIGFRESEKRVWDKVWQREKKVREKVWEKVKEEYKKDGLKRVGKRDASEKVYYMREREREAWRR